MTHLGPGEILDLPLPPNESGAGTVRGYLIALLAALWAEGEGFSGKRPFGSSGWEDDLYTALAQAGVIEGETDREGHLEVSSPEQERKGREIILQAIRALR